MIKDFTKNAVIGGAAGAAFGSACGSAAGIVGLHQICGSLPSYYNCDFLAPIYKNTNGPATAAGAGVGAAVGCVIGAVTYPVYKGIVGWMYNRNDQNDRYQNDVENPPVALPIRVR